MSRVAALWSLLALASLAAAWGLAVHHPLWPVGAPVLVCAVGLASAVWRRFWLVALPAGLPWLNFSPWTGWLVFEEFDLLVLAVLAGAYARLAWQARRPTVRTAHALQVAAGPAGPAPDPLFVLLLAALALWGVLGLVRGFTDAGGWEFGWFQGYTDPLNSLRVSKSLVFALLTVALLREAMHTSPVQACRSFALGMVLGLTSVALAATGERLAYPGLTDFSQVYRVTALFWEMHVGGGAIDAYLAMAAPFAWWTLSAARRPWARLLSFALVVLVVYACIATFSRGVYLAVVVPALLLAAAAYLRHRRLRVAGTAGSSAIRPRVGPGPGMLTWWWLAVAVLVLVVAALDSRSFMMNRLENTDKVWGGRLAHWQNGLGLLETRSDWVLGLGTGRFPARYDRKFHEGDFPGGARWLDRQSVVPGDRAFVRLQGPADNEDLGGTFALTQRVPILPGVRYHLAMDVRVPAQALVLVQVCERHLLYDWYCQGGVLRLPASQTRWLQPSVRLSGRVFSPRPWYAPRLGMLSVSVVNRGGAVDVGRVGLTAQGTGELLANADFSRQLAHWFPAAQSHFLPWHADSLYLETLLERGLPGLWLLGGLFLLALVRVVGAAARGDPLSPFLATSLLGVLLVGSVSSVQDVPRVAFLMYLLAFFAIQRTGLREEVPQADPGLPVGAAGRRLQAGAAAACTHNRWCIGMPCSIGVRSPAERGGQDGVR